MTIREALIEGIAALKTAGIENPGLDASVLLAEVLRMDRAALAASSPEPLAEEALVLFRRLIERRCAGECVAYILGRKEFYGLEFSVNPAVLVPRPDTETLVEAALEKLKKIQAGIAAPGGPACILDLCTGSGAIAVSLKHEIPELEVWAADISASALETAHANAARLLGEGAVHLCLGNLFEPLRPLSPPPFTLITANPPYIPEAEIQKLPPEVQKEPRIALDGGTDGLAIIRTIIAQSPDFLVSGGALFLEADPYQIKMISSLLEANGFVGIQTYRDLSGQERVITGKKP